MDDAIPLFTDLFETAVIGLGSHCMHTMWSSLPTLISANAALAVGSAQIGDLVHR